MCFIFYFQSQDLLSEHSSMVMGSQHYSEASSLSHNIRPYSGASSSSHSFIPRVMARIRPSQRPSVTQRSSLDSSANIRSISQVMGSQSGFEILGLGTGSQSSDPPEIPNRPSSEAIEAFQMDQEFDAGMSTPSDHQSSPDVFQDISDNDSDDDDEEEDDDDSMADIDQDALYQEVDQNHESTYEPKRKFPPGIKIERKVFHEPHLFDSFVSSSNGSEEMLGRSVIIQRLDTNRNNDLHSQPNQEGEIISVEDSMPVSLTPSSPHSPLRPFPESPQIVMDSFQTRHISQNVSAIATLPRSKRVKDKPLSPEPERRKATVPPFPVRQEKLKVEIHATPRTEFPSPTLPSNHPSTPPTRGRLHTWVSK